MQPHHLSQFVNQFWGNKILPTFSEFVRIPCKSPLFDAHWETNGHLEAAAHTLAEWAMAQNIPGLTTKIFKTKKRTPLLYVEIPGVTPHTVLCYGHLDKMPEAEGWHKGFGPWKPVIKNSRLYGRGTADDGYAFFSIIAAIKYLHQAKIPYSKCIILFEACEETDSRDLPYYLEHVKNRIGTVDIVLCLDTGSHDYHNLWCTTSLRGIIEGTLKVHILKAPVHSGVISGIIASTFRVIRRVLSHIEDAHTGEILLSSCYTKIPQEYKQQARAIAKILGKKIYSEFPLLGKTVKPITHRKDELLLNRSWRPTLSIIGAEGLPHIQDAGSVLRPLTALQLSLRIPPYCHPEKITRDLKKALETNPPYGATVHFQPHVSMAGWAMPKMETWLKHTLKGAAQMFFGSDPLYLGEGGSIGVIPLLQKAFPHAQFILTGASGPQSNEHGANESLYLPMAKKITCCTAYIFAKQCEHRKGS